MTVPIEGNINATKGLDALKTIIVEMNREFPQQKDKIRILYVRYPGTFSPKCSYKINVMNAGNLLTPPPPYSSIWGEWEDSILSCELVRPYSCVHSCTVGKIRL